MNKERSGRSHRGNITLLMMVRNAKIKWFSAMSILNEISMKYGDNLSMHDQINFLNNQADGKERDNDKKTKRKERNLLMKTKRTCFGSNGKSLFLFRATDRALVDQQFLF